VANTLEVQLAYLSPSIGKTYM